MSYMHGLHEAVSALESAHTSSERFTLALVALTRTVWHPDCTFDSAIASICEVAAVALRIERVSIWHYDLNERLLKCLHGYDSGSGTHHLPSDFETLSLDGETYLAGLNSARAFDTSDLREGADVSGAHQALREHLSHRRINALLDAPALVEGKLQAVICHESADHRRKWKREEITFAASMGDYVAMAYEIVRRRQAEAEIEHLRLHDRSTGLPNRTYMIELVRQHLSTLKTTANAVAVVHLRIDASRGMARSADSPTVEDMMARNAIVLRQLTDDAIGLARVRDDGFAFLLAGKSHERSAVQLVERALALLREMEWQHDELEPNAVGGIALAEPTDSPDARVLLRRAEEAAGIALKEGKFGYAVFDVNQHVSLLEMLRLGRLLRSAFENGDFEMHYQAEYNAESCQWVAAEALLRWRRGDSIVVAGEFIDVIESSDLMLPVGRWVLQQACQDALHWPTAVAGCEMHVRVNVSARQFDDDHLIEDVATALAHSGLAPSRLCLEVTETTLMRDIEHTTDVLRKIRDLGVQIAIDDFGTGYASLTYLKRLPVDVIKIDRSFVSGVPSVVVDAAIVRAVVGLAASLGIEVVAEGVERAEQRNALRAVGVHRMQGWLFASAISSSDLCDLLRSESRRFENTESTVDEDPHIQG